MLRSHCFHRCSEQENVGVVMVVLLACVGRGQTLRPDDAMYAMAREFARFTEYIVPTGTLLASVIFLIPSGLPFFRNCEFSQA